MGERWFCCREIYFAAGLLLLRRLGLFRSIFGSVGGGVIVEEVGGGLDAATCAGEQLLQLRVVCQLRVVPSPTIARSLATAE